jgi:hypothetical protein
MALVRRSGGGGAPVGDVAALDASISAVSPTLVEWLTTLKWENGDKRQTGTVMVLAEDGVWKAWLHDRDGRCSGWLSAGSLFDLLVAIEEGLVNNSVNWRADKAPGRK